MSYPRYLFNQEKYSKDVSGDWHGVNGTALYGDEYTNCTSDKIKKALRGISKIVGLALLYGGSSYTVSKTMKSTQDEAQVKIDGFWRLLTGAAQWKEKAITTVWAKHTTKNIFGRTRNLKKWILGTRSQANYAERTSLNHPIQGSAADVLKMGMIKAMGLIDRLTFDPLSGLDLPKI